MTARVEQLLEAARRVAFFGETDLRELRAAVAELDEQERFRPDDEDEDEETV